MIKEVLHPKVHYYRNVIEDPELFIKDIEESDLMDSYLPQISSWSPWFASNSEERFGEQKECLFNLFRNQVLADRINFKICSVVAHKSIHIGESYCRDNDMDLGYMPEKFYIRKYDVGAYMGPHIDVSRKEKSTVSMVIYLNDNYEGGKINFPELGLSVKPEAGSAVVFESSSILHEPEATKSGVKYVIPLFFYKR